MGMVLLTDKVREKNTFEGNKGMFLSTLDEEAWQSLLSDINQRVENKANVEDFMEELWVTVVKFGEPFLIGTGLDENVRKELLEKKIGPRKQKQDTGAKPCKDSTTLSKKNDDRKISVEVDDKNKTSIMIKDINILKGEARVGGRQESEKRDLVKEVETVMVVTTPPSRGVRSRKRNREAEEASPSADAVSEKNLKKIAPMILARWKTAAYKGGLAARKLTEVMVEVEASTTRGKEEDFKPQNANAKRGFIIGQMWKVNVQKEWISTQHQDAGNQVTSDPLERGATRNTNRPWWISLETTNELENCLKVSRKRQKWATQQRAEINKLEFQSQLGRTWENLRQEYFEDAMRAPSSATSFGMTAGQLLFSRSLAGVALEALTSYEKPRLGDAGTRVYQILVQPIARDNSGLSKRGGKMPPAS